MSAIASEITSEIRVSLIEPSAFGLRCFTSVGGLLLWSLIADTLSARGGSDLSRYALGEIGVHSFEPLADPSSPVSPDPPRGRRRRRFGRFEDERFDPEGFSVPSPDAFGASPSPLADLSRRSGASYPSPDLRRAASAGVATGATSSFRRVRLVWACLFVAGGSAASPSLRSLRG
ncbi:MAG: hypothetical protein ACFHWZ_04575 [Phycisphaerales bacterium]